MKPLNHQDLPPSDLLLAGEYDRLFAGQDYPHPFKFNSEVAEVFDSMAVRSIPLYRETIDCIAHWAELKSAVPGKIIDLGCSTGTTLLALGQRLLQARQFVGVDQSSPMLEKAKLKLSLLPERHKVDLINENALNLDLNGAAMIIMNYTLQFIEHSLRPSLLRQIYLGLNSGGIFFLSEKVCSNSPKIQAVMTEIYEAFKSRNGYSASEIERKKEALERVLMPLTPQEQLDQILAAGFSDCEPVLRWNNFVTYVAKKK